ncbi:MAG TPA: hypothetical protein PKD10_00125 [Paracoccaceae bacterium]|nr:hypothetical protein [Paracoccaceae bacterium]HMO70050.1 hypothetical protein [Paracoccaceae bacterium]
MFALNGIKALAAALVLSGGLAGQAGAVTYHFDNITGNNAEHAAAGAAQLFLDVDLVDDAVHFVFRNAGPLQMTVANLYIDHGTTALIQNASVGAASEGVEFAGGGTPVNVPRGNTVGFYADDTFYTTRPRVHYGINVLEFQTIVYELVAGTTFSDLIAALDAGNLRAGLHVINFIGGGRESFVSGAQVVPIPLPATGLLLVGALGGLVLLRRRRPAA